MEFWSLQKWIFVFKYIYPQFWNTAIPKNRRIIDIFRVDSGFFDTRLKILTPAPHVVHVTHIRYATRAPQVTIIVAKGAFLMPKIQLGGNGSIWAPSTRLLSIYQEERINVQLFSFKGALYIAQAHGIHTDP